MTLRSRRTATADDRPADRRWHAGPAVLPCTALLACTAVLLPGVAAAQDGGSIDATVTVSDQVEACILVSATDLDFGTLDFGTTADSGPYEVTSCSQNNQTVYATTTAAATGGSVTWQPIASSTPGTDAFAVDAALDAGTPVLLTADPARVGPLAARASGQAAHRFYAPQPGSAGAGQPMTFELTWTGVLEGVWSSQTSGITQTLRDVTFLDANRGWVVGNAGTILMTTDGGDRWAAQTSGTTRHLAGVAFVDANRGWVVGDAGTILATTNGGATWIAQTSPSDVNLRGVAFVDANRGWVVGDAETILATTNSGATWNPQQPVERDATRDLYGVSFANATHGWAVGRTTARWTILATADGGATWTTQPIGTHRTMNAVAFVDANRGWVVGNWGVIRATTDGGATWNTQTCPTSNYDLRGVAFVDANRGWAVGPRHVCVTTDGGATWTVQAYIFGVYNPLSGVAFADATRGWAVGDAGTILTYRP